MEVIFSDRAYTAIMAETAERIKTETGGLFLGTVKDDTWYIIEAIDPGPNSTFEVTFFEYDQKYTQHLINKVANLYQKKLSLVGLWHRHPGSYDIFSNVDDKTNAKYAAMRPQGAVSMLINIDPAFRMTVYHVDYPHDYRVISYRVGDELIPKEYLALAAPEQFRHTMCKGMGLSYEQVYSPFHCDLGLFIDSIFPQLSAIKPDEQETAEAENNGGEQETDKISGATKPEEQEDKDKTGKKEKVKKEKKRLKFHTGKSEQAVNSEASDSGDAEEQVNLLDVIEEDIYFMTDKLKIKLLMKENDVGIVLSQSGKDNISLIFSYEKDAQEATVEYCGVKYAYKPGLFKSLYENMEAQGLIKNC